jgi:hypothetical protein
VNIGSKSRKQRPLRRREAFLERQRLVAERAEKRMLDELARRIPPANWHDYAVAGYRHGRQFPDYARRKMAAKALPDCLLDILNGPMPGDPVDHFKFGRGTVVAVDGNKVDVEFAGVGRKRILADFLVRQ